MIEAFKNNAMAYYFILSPFPTQNLISQAAIFFYLDYQPFRFPIHPSPYCLSTPLSSPHLL